MFPNFKYKNILMIFSVIVALAVLILGLVFIKERQKTKTEASGVSLALTSDSLPKSVGSSFVVTVEINDGGSKISATDLKINYDPNLLTVTKVSKGTFLPTTLIPTQILASSVRIVQSVFVDDQGPHFNTGSGFLAQITFNVKASGNTAIQFDPSTVVTAVGQTTNAVSSKGSLALTLESAVSTPPQSPLPPVSAWWKLDEASGNALDSSGNNLTGAVTGTTVTTGKYGRARSFNSSSYITIPNNSVLANQSQLTVTGWLYLSSLPSNSSLYYIPFGRETSFRFIIGSTGGMHFVVSTKNNPWYSAGTLADSTQKLTTGSWHHLAGVYNGNKVYLYLDGNLVGTGSSSISGNISDPSTQLKIGSSGVQNFNSPNGTVDNVKIYKVALTQDQIKKDMESY